MPLENTNLFDIKMKLSGLLKKLKIELSSDLDSNIGEQIKLLNTQKNTTIQHIPYDPIQPV